VRIGIERAAQQRRADECSKLKAAGIFALPGSKGSKIHSYEIFPSQVSEANHVAPDVNQNAGLRSGTKIYLPRGNSEDPLRKVVERISMAR
jgi:hypothetical protein